MKQVEISYHYGGVEGVVGYALRPQVRSLREPEAHYGAEVAQIPLSVEGEEIRALIRQPLLKRSRVGFEREFLENYEPGLSQYLPVSVRRRFHELGRLPDRASDILEAFRMDFVWASSRLEGCRYIRHEVEKLIASGKPASGGYTAEARLVLNHDVAVVALIEDLSGISLDAFTLRTLHAVLSSGLRPRRGGIAPALSPVLPLAENSFRLFIEKAAAIPDPFEQAFFAFMHLLYLQPFADANKPLSRLAANIPLFQHGLCPLSFIDVPRMSYTEGALGVYELGRIELLRDVFVWAYERSCLRYRRRNRFLS